MIMSRPGGRVYYVSQPSPTHQVIYVQTDADQRQPPPTYPEHVVVHQPSQVYDTAYLLTHLHSLMPVISCGFPLPPPRYPSESTVSLLDINSSAKYKILSNISLGRTTAVGVAMPDFKTGFMPSNGTMSVLSTQYKRRTSQAGG